MSNNAQFAHCMLLHRERFVQEGQQVLLDTPVALPSLQENASRPEGLAPNQGGKYVGFGSTPAPSSKPPGGKHGAGLDDYQQYLSKGISSLTTVAGQQLPCCFITTLISHKLGFSSKPVKNCCVVAYLV